MKKVIVANWKMNPLSQKQAKDLFNFTKKVAKNLKNVQVVICPPFLYLPLLSKLAKNSKIKLGAQNCFWEEKGAFTGEISPAMLKDLKVKYVILGHSERRKLGETDEMINKKLKTALQFKLTPILCIGEKEKEKKEGKTFEVLETQCTLALNGIFQPNLMLAYEPVWAIGTQNPCPPEIAKKVLEFLKKKFPHPPILYGGSVNVKNAISYFNVGFDGLLVGGASLSFEFGEILKMVDKIKK
ncbi:triose-phosphate isomerase [Candidatus Parcubacteria bacterium]|nr:triose-phosphate isomerase [Candidatus Parcubacteria bacterium]